jgi:hypothetical protein
MTGTRGMPDGAAVDQLRVELDGDAGLELACRRFAEHGAVIARALVPSATIDELRAEIRELITLARRRAELPLVAGRFDAGFEELCAVDPAAGPAIFDACRRLASVHRLSVAPPLLELSKRLMQTELVMLPPYKPVRIDWHEREAALLPWHQDYPYAQDSLDGVVYWIPLVDVDEHNGCLEVALGSQRGGVQPVAMIEPASGGAGVRGLRIADPSVVERWTRVRLPMRAGEVLVLSALLLHRSHTNRSGEVRWTVQVRHGNFAHPTAVAKRWPRGHYERHWFDETHPEHVLERAGG